MSLQKMTKDLVWARKRKKITQKDMATTLGVCTATMSLYETNLRVPQIDFFEKWANELGYEVRLLLK